MTLPPTSATPDATTPGAPDTLPAGASAGAAQDAPRRPGPSRRRRLLLPVSGAVAALVLTGGAAGYAQAHKSVTLDVDGTLTEVGTFAGSVDELLVEHGVAVGDRDAVAPADGALADGTTVVVRHARSLLVEQDGATRAVWSTALTADAALEAMAERGAPGQLVASRSSGGRADLGLELADGGPVDVLVDGTTLQTPDGAVGVAEVLVELGVTLGPLDRVGVREDADGRVQVVVERVVEQDVTTTSEVAFATVERDDAARTVGTRRVLTAGVPGVRTVVEHVTTVDGVETARTPVSDAVTQAPVDEVVAVGTKPRPVAAPARAAAPSGTAAAADAGSAPAASTGSAGSLNWAALAACESGGNPSIVSASGRYHGLYQFSVTTWQAVGGSGLPSQASAAEQTARAQALYERSGAGQWPHCGPRLFS
ncbi:resuscitation-promoting factor [Cellulomonas endophytica]|uniref:resuscitation-promoting factor n=1 Tax=Cellulomonas endophytica TaxID=2494735 RepID=UPI001F0B8074|nr:resuscitation-promoting factor [Cellulomonas endophytica]